MATRHLDDPLEYLYEELPPQAMAAARAHLAECPQCREETTAIRAIVHAYRAEPRPTPPDDLIKAALTAVMTERDRRVKAAAAAENKKSSEPVEPPPPAIPSVPRNWLLHPAWIVAAGVVFACALLIHFSPRREGLRAKIDPEPAQPRPMPVAHQTMHVVLPSAAAFQASADPEPEQTPSVIMLTPPEPPEFVPRPAGGPDRETLVFDLGVLAGMQIGADELDDAQTTVSRLAQIAPHRAQALQSMIEFRLAAAEQARQRPPEPEPESHEADTQTPPPADTQAQGPKAPLPEKAEPAAPEPQQEITPPVIEPRAEPGKYASVPEETPEPSVVQEIQTIVPQADRQPDTAAPQTIEILPEPLTIDQAPPPDAGPRFFPQPETLIPAEPLIVEQPQFQPRRRPFSTDPYYREY